MLSILAASLTLMAQTATEPLHPVFHPTRASFEAIWARGTADGTGKRSPNKAFNLSKRQIDSYHVSKMDKEGCAWAYLVLPQILVYMSAQNAAKQYWGAAETEVARTKMIEMADAELRYVAFFVELNEMPSFNGGWGRMNRAADPANLTDVRCVLRVGKQIIQPVEQPGDLTLSKTDQIGFATIPTTAYATGQTTNGSGETMTTSFHVTTYHSEEQPYSTFRGQFLVFFPLRSPEGTPLVTPKDKEIELVVVKRSAELKAKYRLNDWIKTLEK